MSVGKKEQEIKASCSRSHTHLVTNIYGNAMTYSWFTGYSDKLEEHTTHVCKCEDRN